MTKSKLRATEYRTRAREASAFAAACVLDRTREQYEQAASRWNELADDQERRTLEIAALS